MSGGGRVVGTVPTPGPPRGPFTATVRPAIHHPPPLSFDQNSVIYSFIHLNVFPTVGTDAADSSACGVVVFFLVVVKITFLWLFIQTHFTFKIKSKMTIK